MATSKKIIGTPIKVGKIEIAQYDFPKQMNWNDAKDACAKLGSGWRLPDKEELNLIYKKKDDIGCFENFSYWSSTEHETDNGYPGAWHQNFIGEQKYSNISYTTYVRAVRSL